MNETQEQLMQRGRELQEALQQQDRRMIDCWQYVSRSGYDISEEDHRLRVLVRSWREFEREAAEAGIDAKQKFPFSGDIVTAAIEVWRAREGLAEKWTRQDLVKELFVEGCFINDKPAEPAKRPSRFPLEFWP
jgi:hypothetical protein